MSDYMNLKYHVKNNCVQHNMSKNNFIIWKGMTMDQLIYHKKKLYQLSDYMETVLLGSTSASSMFNSESQRIRGNKKDMQ